MSPLVVALQVLRNPDEPFDAVACRPEVYGEGSEGSAYLLQWAHMADILDRNFDCSFIQRVRVPRLQ